MPRSLEDTMRRELKQMYTRKAHRVPLVRIAEETGVCQSQLSRFINSGQALGIHHVEALMEYLEITWQKKTKP